MFVKENKLGHDIHCPLCQEKIEQFCYDMMGRFLVNGKWTTDIFCICPHCALEFIVFCNKGDLGEKN